MAAIEDEGPERLAASEFDGVNAEHALRAVQRLRDGYDGHSFGASIDYNVVLEDGSRLPPKAVFGLAATEALGFEVLPKHFTGGEGSICFNRLREWGYRIEPKADEQDEEAPAQGMDLSSRASGGGFLHTVNKTTLAEGIRIPIEQHALFQADPLPRGKSDSIEIIMDGHSFEGRLYHENPKEVDREMMSFRYKSNAELLEVIGSYFPQLGGTLRVVVRSPRRVELVPEDVQAGLQEAVVKARGRSVDELREAATGRKGAVKVTTSTTKAYVRSADVIAYVVQRADGGCEGCGRAAPFKKPNGDPYLEVHHIKRLAEGGPDTAENAAGLCPNCHRRAHSSADRDEFSRSLREKISGL